MFRPVLLLVTAAFGAFSLYAMWQVGYVGLWTGQFATAGTLQVLIDLVIVCALAAGWMIRDARSKGRVVWPYVAITLAAGSFGPLLYLLLAPRSVRAAAGAPQAAT
jgi:hypothetical protein